MTNLAKDAYEARLANRAMSLREALEQNAELRKRFEDLVGKAVEKADKEKRDE